MYRSSSTSSFLHNRKFDSLAKAKRFADKHGDKHPVDILALVDRDTFRYVYTGGSTFSKGYRGTYQKANHPEY